MNNRKVAQLSSNYSKKKSLSSDHFCFCSMQQLRLGFLINFQRKKKHQTSWSTKKNICTSILPYQTNFFFNWAPFKFAFVKRKIIWLHTSFSAKWKVRNLGKVLNYYSKDDMHGQLYKKFNFFYRGSGKRKSAR